MQRQTGPRGSRGRCGPGDRRNTLNIMIFVRTLITLLVTLCLTGTASSVRAQESLNAGPSLTVSQNEIKPLSDAFYKRCMSKPSPNLQAEENDEYCLCLSVQLYRKSLTQDERRFLATGEGGKIDPRRATSEVYGQCIGVPGRAATYHKCTHTPDIYKYVKGEDDLKSMCSCVRDMMGDYWDKEAPAFIEMTQRSPKRKFDDDILSALMNGRDFPVRYATQRSACVRKYGRRD